MKKVINTLIIAVLALPSQLSAQINAPTPYCSTTFDDWSTGDGLIDIGYIDGVTLNTINNQSTGGNGQEDYVYYNNLSTDIQQNQVYTLDVTVGEWGHKILAWIDYDKSDSFEESELIALSPSYIGGSIGTFSFTFTVPLSATLGTTRMRVVFCEYDNGPLNAQTGACDVFNSGETEDYNVNIVPSPVGFGDVLIEEQSFVVYPNPSSGVVKIENIEELESATVYSFNGQIVIESSLNSDLDLSSLPKGPYMLILVSKNGNVIREKLIMN